jgi:hypothetical protein
MKRPCSGSWSSNGTVSRLPTSALHPADDLGGAAGDHTRTLCGEVAGLAGYERQNTARASDEGDLAPTPRARVKALNVGLFFLEGEYSFNLLEVIQVVSRKHPHDCPDALGTPFVVYAFVLPLVGRERLQ